ncbi:MAG: primosomal protein N' [Prevotella sp.]|nr:primosomal protein N' [Prevotella sp.]
MIYCSPLPRYVNVILPLPLEGEFTYSVPDDLQAQVAVGVRVVVPLGKSKTYVALVTAVLDSMPEPLLASGQADKVRPLHQVADDAPVVLDSQLELWRWIADYYMSPIGEVMKAALPSGMKQEDGYVPKTETWVSLAEPFRSEEALHLALDMLRRAPRQRDIMLTLIEMMPAADYSFTLSRDELLNSSHSTPLAFRQLQERGILATYQREVGRLNRGGEPSPQNIKPLTPPQADAYNRLLVEMMSHRVTLLHGVTSSGKTELYIHLIQRAIDRGEQVLYLLPEIALTVQITTRLQRVFGRRLGIYHSKYSDAERVEIWQKQLSASPYDVILGARSACLLPFQRLGLVIIDEEHENSFKQQDPAPRYHARSTAIMMAHMSDARVVLGTATPSVESYHNAMNGKYGLVELTQRYQGIELPRIEVVDIKDLRRRKMMNGPFSPQLLAAMRATFERGEQAILFQNRRGFAPMIECRECGWVPKCQNCDVSLTLHKNLNMLTCHYCGFTYPVPQKCPNCESTDLRGRGYGTEKIEDQVQTIFPDIKVARMDLDTTRTRTAYERLISDFSQGKTQLLIGTQMVTKGLDFDRVSLVGILDADAMLNYPDFRSYEHAFMMMAQVAGRAGRKGRQGLVILQTRNPELPVVGQVVVNDYAGFYRSLLAERRDFCYPPYFRLVYVYLKHRHDDLVSTAATELAGRMRQVFGKRVLGPDKPAVARVKQLHIRKIVLKVETAADYRRVRTALRTIQAQLMADKRYSQLQIYFDVDPQ